MKHPIDRFGDALEEVIRKEVEALSYQTARGQVGGWPEYQKVLGKIGALLWTLDRVKEERIKWLES